MLRHWEPSVDGFVGVFGFTEVIVGAGAVVRCGIETCPRSATFINPTEALVASDVSEGSTDQERDAGARLCEEHRQHHRPQWEAPERGS